MYVSWKIKTTSQSFMLFMSVIDTLDSSGCFIHYFQLWQVVAIKQMKTTKSEDFFAALNILCRAYHNNLVQYLSTVHFIHFLENFANT